MPHSFHLRLVGVVAVLALAAFTVQCLGAAPAGATSPGKNGEIAFDRSSVTICRDIYTINPDGTGIKKLVSNACFPAWSPNGARIAFSTARSGADAVWIMRADGTGLRQVTHPKNGTADDEPTWSPNGKRIAFLHISSVGVYDIWIVRVDGSGLRQLTSGHEPNVQPVWSPDGQWIAFSDENVWLIHPNGTGLTQLTQGNGHDPCWAPSGQRIAFARVSGKGNMDVWTIRIDGTGLRRLTTDPAVDRYPAWSPDGRKIAFSSDRSGEYKIWVVPAKGGRAKQLTWLAGVGDLSPNWQPIPR